MEKARRKTDRLNDFTGGFISGCSLGLLELNTSKNKYKIFKNSRHAMKSIFGYGIFVGGIYGMLLNPRLPE